MKQEEGVRTSQRETEPGSAKPFREIGRAGGAKADLGVMSTTATSLDF